MGETLRNIYLCACAQLLTRRHLVLLPHEFNDTPAEVQHEVSFAIANYC